MLMVLEHVMRHLDVPMCIFTDNDQTHTLQQMNGMFIRFIVKDVWVQLSCKPMVPALCTFLVRYTIHRPV